MVLHREPFGISVIMPVYNAQRFLQEALRSVTTQTYRNIEILCVDDGSLDNSLSILHEMALGDNRIQVCQQEHVGAGGARNYALAVARGEYVAFLDADDLYPSSDVLQVLYDKAKAHGASICGGSFSHLYKGGKTTHHDEVTDGYTFETEGFIDYCDYQFDYGYTRFLYKRSFLLEHQLVFPPYLRYQDPPFFVRAMIAARRFYAVPKVVYCYRVGHKEVSWNQERLLGLANGLEEVLRMSSTHQLAALHLTAIKRIDEDWYAPLTDAVLGADTLITAAMYRLNSQIDISLLRTAGEDVTLPYVIRPLRVQYDSKSYSAIMDGRIQDQRDVPMQDEDVSVGREPVHVTVEDPWSYRVGRIVTFLPRGLKRLVRSVRLHGVSYAWQRLLYTIRNFR